MDAPYVVSADIRFLLKEWSFPSLHVIPGKDFFVALRKDFSDFMSEIFPIFEMVSEEEISIGLNGLIRKVGLAPIALDRVYLPIAQHIDVTRLVDCAGKECGLGPRSCLTGITEQIGMIIDTGVRKVVLVDDVIFSGGLILRLVECLSRAGISVPVVCAGVGIRKGVDRIKRSGVEVLCVRLYDEVIDEVCERDFYPGVPYSGRELVGGGGVGLPYLLPFGDPVKWASIPENKKEEFSRFCIRQTIRLFEEIEARSMRVVRCCDLTRFVIGFPRDTTRFVDCLRAI